MTPPPRPTPPDRDDDVQGRIRELEGERRELQARFEKTNASLAEAQATRQALESQHKTLEQRLDDIERKLGQTEDTLSKAQAELREQEGELGGFRAIAETVPQLQRDLQSARAEADDARRQLVEATPAFERRVAEQVQAALERVRKEHEESAAQWQADRRRIEDRVKELERDEGGEAAPSVRTSDLAGQFRTILEKFAEPAEADAPIGAVLTGLEVEARGLLVPPAEGEELPRLVTVDPAKVVHPEALSTVRLRYGLLPRLPPDVEPTPPPDR